jgi:hypothetical protein
LEFSFIFYLWNASEAWAIPEESGLDVATAGSALVWGLGALPIALVSLLVDGAWWVVAFRKKLQKWPVMLVSIVWLVAIVVDFYHH